MHTNRGFPDYLRKISVPIQQKKALERGKWEIFSFKCGNYCFKLILMIIVQSLIQRFKCNHKTYEIGARHISHLFFVEKIAYFKYSIFFIETT